MPKYPVEVDRKGKIPHLLELGINAVELLPVFEFDELDFQRRPNPRDHMVRWDDIEAARRNRVSPLEIEPSGSASNSINLMSAGLKWTRIGMTSVKLEFPTPGKSLSLCSLSASLNPIPISKYYKRSH
ncbi:hypothetical protein JHK82_033957 [Glycine max]|nr:hypothetical protein JHK85_034665 [Glycine max]KAG5119537.1 hypothetical protein JHK82_033957 [Glycine max]KAG5140524.1 hypothetical protein JHK84_034292 [Glycine max]